MITPHSQADTAVGDQEQGHLVHFPPRLSNATATDLNMTCNICTRREVVQPGSEPSTAQSQSVTGFAHPCMLPVVQDKRVSFDEWGAKGGIKSIAPFGQLPVLEVDGKHIAQSAANGEQATSSLLCRTAAVTQHDESGLLQVTGLGMCLTVLSVPYSAYHSCVCTIMLSRPLYCQADRLPADRPLDSTAGRPGILL